MAFYNRFAITAPTTTVPNVQRRIHFLLCLAQAKLPHLPLELVVCIAKDVTCQVFTCCECNSTIIKGNQYAGAGNSVFCSSACFEKVPELIDWVVALALGDGMPVRPREMLRGSI